MFNRVILVGRLTRDPELRYLQNGTALATFGIATNRTWTDKNTNEKKEEVMFIDIITFARSAEGNKVLVEGRLVLDRWTDQNGQKRSKHTVRADTVQFMETRAEAQNSQNSYNAPSQGGYNQNGQYAQPNKPSPSSQSNDISEIDIDDEEIPF